MQSWHELMDHPILKNKQFISLNDLQPSRYALSYIPNPNRRAYWMEVAFMALDSEKLGEHVDAAFHYDFGDNMFPHFKGNRKQSLCLKNKIKAMKRTKKTTTINFLV